MTLWDLRTFDPDEKLLAKLCLKLNFFSIEQLEEIVRHSGGKQLIFSLSDSGYLDESQLSELFRIRKVSVLCKHCGSINFPPQTGTSICENCGKGLQIRSRITESSLPNQYGKYKLSHEIASGSVGVVYKANHVDLGRTIALKILKSDQITQSLLLRFKQEAKSAACLEHPNIVQIYDIGEERGVHYIAMEYIEGRPLSHHIQEKKLSIHRACQIAEEIAQGLQHAHEKKIIHRDIKPDNILIETEDNTVKITDFGLARQITNNIRITHQDIRMGTPLYMSPEQARGEHNIGPATDIYSLGIVLYEMLVGQTPFYQNSRHLLFEEIIHNDPVPLQKLNPMVPASLEKICLKAIAKGPGERFESAEQMRIALAEFRGETLDAALFPDEQLHDLPPTQVGFSTTGMSAGKKTFKQRMMEIQEQDKQRKFEAWDLYVDLGMWGLLTAGILYLIYLLI